MAGVNAGTVYASVRADTRKLGTDLLTAQQKIEKTMGKAFKYMGVAAAAGAAVAIYEIQKIGRESVALAKIQESVEKRLEAVIKATGQAAGYNITQLKDMASAMQRVTTVGDEVIISGMSILATFKNIRGEGFERATKAALDMSEVLGQDLKSSAIMLGKALNDPVLGMSAMTRAGIQFTDAQKEMAKGMVKVGDIAGAQAIIFEELEGQMGGAAAAARDTFAGATDAASNAMGDLEEEMGFVITKSATMIDYIKELEKWFVEAGDAVSNWVDANRLLIDQKIAKIIDGITTAAKGAWEALKLLWDIVSMSWTLLSALPKGVIEYFENINKAARKASDGVSNLNDELDELGNKKPSSLILLIDWLDKVGDSMLYFLDYVLKGVGAYIAAMADDFIDFWWFVGQGFHNVGLAIVAFLVGEWDVGMEHLRNLGKEGNTLAKNMEQTHKAASTAIGDAWDEMTSRMFDRWGGSSNTSSNYNSLMTDWLGITNDINDSTEKVRDTVKKLTDKELKALQKRIEKIKKILEDKAIAEAWKAQDMADWVRAGNQAMQDMEREFGSYMDGVYQDIEKTNTKVEQDVKKTTDMTYDLWMRAMNRVEESIEDTFYELFTGQFDSIGDAFDSMLDDMLRMLAAFAAKATMYDLLGVGDKGSGWGSLFSGSGSSSGIFSGGGGAGGSGGGMMDWISSLFSAGKSGYELYTGESLMGQVYNFLSEAVAGIFATEVGSAYVGMYAEITMAEVEAMASSALAGGSGAYTGAGAAGAGQMSSAAASGIVAAITAAIVGGFMIFDNNTKPDAELSAAFGARISDDYNRLFNVEFLNLLGQTGFSEGDIETELNYLFGTVAESFSHFEKIWSVLSEESQQDLKESLKSIDWDEFVMTIRAYAQDGGPLDVQGIFGPGGYKDWIKSGSPSSGLYDWKEGDEGTGMWLERQGYINPETGQPYTADDYSGTGKAGNSTAVVWDIIHEYFQPYLGEAVAALMDMDVYGVMSDEFQASVEKLLTDEAWSGGVEAYFQTFGDNIDKLYEAAAAYDNFNSLIDGTANEYTEMDRAVSLASASTAAYVAALEAAGEELSEEDIQEIATEWAQYYAQMSDDLSAVTTEATALDQAIAALTGQFEAYWQEMIDAGIDVEKLGDKTELLDDAIQNLIDTMQTAVWDEITKSIQAMMSAVGSVESAVNNAIAALYQMKLAMDQVNASAEQYADFEAQALAALKYQMGLGSGYDRQAEIDERYGFLGVGYKEIIEAFAKLDIDSLKALAESWGINWWEIAEDVAWMIDNLEGAGDAASSAGADFAKLGEEIRSILSAVSDTFSGANSAANIMTQITDLQSIPMEEMTGDNLLAMSNKLVQWYNAAVAEAQNAAREEQDAANLLIRVADRLSSLITQIDSTIRSIKYSNLNISLPNQKAISAQGDYDTLLAAAQTGGVAEVQEYLGFAQTYLQQQQNTYKSSTAYQDKYTSVMSDMEAIKGRAEAGGYDAAILAELTRGNAQIEVDLSAIQATFSELESWILNALHQIEVISVLRIIWEDEWTPAQAAAISDLLTLVQEYGWDYEATITFIGELPMDLFEDLNEIATMAGWIASESGGWESSATISFIRNVAENWEWESLNEIMHALGWVREQAGSWTAGATIGFIAGLFDRYGIEYDSYAYWLGQLGVPDDAIPDVMAKLIFEAFQGSGMAIDDIDDYLTSLGITDSALRRDIEVQLVYNLHASGDIATEELADWAYAKLIAASTESVSNAYDMVDQVMALIRMFGVVDNSGNVGSILYQWSELARAGFPSSYYLGQGVQHVMDYAGWNEWAEGGVVSSPSLGWVGEAGYPEAIIPMKDGMNIPVKWVNGGSTQEGSERPLNIVVEVGGQEFNAIIDQRADDIRVRAERRKVGATRIVQ